MPPLRFRVLIPRASRSRYAVVLALVALLAATVFVAADGSLPFQLPDGRVLWFFGDTIVGRSQDGVAVDPFLFMARNSMVVQEGPCFTPRLEVLPNQPDGKWLWPVDFFLEGGWLRIVVMHMKPAPGPPGFEFEFVRVEEATFSLSHLQFQALHQFPIATTPGDPSYGENITVDATSGYVYAYGRKRVSTLQDHHYVARVQLNQFGTRRCGDS